MWFRTKKTAPGLTEDLVQRVWDCTSRLKQLEDRFDGQLEELSKRYRRAEQSEKRLEGKKASPCEDEEAATLNGDSRPGRALAALRSRKGSRRITSEV